MSSFALCIDLEQFTSEGSITLRAFQENEDEDMVKVRVEIEDTGCGIQQAQMAKLFRPFSQADSSTARRFGMAVRLRCIMHDLRCLV